MDSTSTQNHSFSSSSHSTPILNYDVFLSFRGIDTRKNFIDHLYDALMNRSGIRTFKDDDNKRSKGETISLELIKGIEESRISVIIFSVNYASSQWCLDELVKIIDCKNTRGLLVLPVFYHIDPSDVRKQTGSYAEAFSKHEENYEMEKVQKWRSALSEVGSLSGWDLNSYLEGNESTFIKNIVKEVQLTLAQGNLLLLDKEEAKLKEKEQGNTKNMKVVAVALEKGDKKMKDDLQKKMEVLKEEATNLSVERANLDIRRSLLLGDLTALLR